MMDAIKKEVKLAFIENKRIIVASTLILFISVILGFVFKPYLFNYLNPVVEEFTNKVRTGAIQLTFHDIFLNNILVVLRMFIFGLFFCISALILAFNGFFTGYYLATAPNLKVVLLLTVPHGIFEFPSCILACASGFILFKFAHNLIKTFKNEKEMRLINRFVYSYSENYNILLQAFIILAAASILMAIAGFVECYITLPLGKFLMTILS